KQKVIGACRSLRCDNAAPRLSLTVEQRFVPHAAESSSGQTYPAGSIPTFRPGKGVNTMIPSISLERLTEGIARAQEHWFGRAGRQGTVPAFTIALHREAGAPGTSVARTIGEKLRWPVYDQELVERIANDMGLRPALVESVDERSRSWLLEAMEGFTSAP